jgi:hypothetical protein
MADNAIDMSCSEGVLDGTYPYGRSLQYVCQFGGVAVTLFGMGTVVSWKALAIQADGIGPQ